MGLLIRAALAAVLLSAAAEGCASGETRPDAAPASLAVTDLDGRAHALDRALESGETVALVFWQTWCRSCAREAPAIVDAERRHGERIRFIGVVPGRDGTVDDAEVRAVAARWDYRFPQVRDRDLALSRRFAVTGTPAVVVLGPGGVRYSGHRPPGDWLSFAGCRDGVCPVPAK